MGQDSMTRQLYVQSIKSILQYNAVRNPGAPALLIRGSDGEMAHVSYRKLQNCVNRLGASLMRRGLADSHIAVIGKNSASWCYSFLAILCGVGVAVPIDRETDADNLLHLLRFTSVKAVFADAASIKKLNSIAKKLPKRIKIFALEEVENKTIPTVSQLIEEGEAIIDAGDDTFLNRSVDPDALALLLFTSGTTDHVKAVMLSNRNICADLMLVSRRVDLTSCDSTLCILPLHHAYQMICMLLMLYVGGSVGFCSGLRELSRDLAFYSPSVFVTVPLMLEKMHKKIFEQLSKQSGIKRAFATGKLSGLLERFELTDFRRFVYKLIHQAFGGKMRLIICGAAALNAGVARDFAGFGIPVVTGYGLTECSPIVMCNSASTPQFDSVGKPLDEVSVLLSDADETGAGEICVKGPIVMMGYYKNKKATAAVMRDGWFHTGDLGFCDENGNYHITGRVKNVIVTKGGKNIYPEELESYLNNDPVVLESLIFGESLDGDETVSVEVVPDVDAIREKTGKTELSNADVQRAVHDVIRRINRILPRYKTIRRVLIRKDRLDHAALSKVKRTTESSSHQSEESTKTIMQEDEV